MNRDEIFKQAAEANKKEQEVAAQKKAQAESSSSGNPNFTPISYSVLSEDWGLYRIVGLPMNEDGSPRDEFSPRLVSMSTIRDDEGSLFKCYFPQKSSQPDWIMWKVLDLVLATSWADGKRVPKFEVSNPEIFNLVNKNGKQKNSTGFSYERGWYPILYVPMNVIDRSRADWHKENKHTLALTKKMSIGKKRNPDEEERYFFDIGATATVYNGLMGIVSFSGDWENYDVVIRKLGDNPWYEVDYPVADSPKFQKIASSIVKGPLTEEERAYEKYDFSRMYHPTSYQKLFARLQKTFIKIDKEFGTSFFKELQSLAEEERRNSPNKYTEGSTATDMPPENVVEDTPPSRSTDTLAPRPTSNSDIALDESVYKGASKLTDLERSMITGAKDGKLVYKNEAGKLFACSNKECNYPAPETFHICPKCGVQF